MFLKSVIGCVFCIVFCHCHGGVDHGGGDHGGGDAQVGGSRAVARDSVKAADSGQTARAADSGAVSANDDGGRAFSITDEDDYPGKELLFDSTRRRILTEFGASEHIYSGRCSISRVFSADGYIFLVVDVSDDVCTRGYLLLYRDNHISRCAALNENCDSDLSWASYGYIDVETLSDTVYRLTKVKEVIKDSTLIDKDGFIKGDKSRDELPVKTDSAVVQITPSFLLSARVAAWPKVWRFDVR